MLKNLPAKQETWVQSLAQEDPLEKEMATHSSILAGEIPRAKEPGGLLSTTERLNHHHQGAPSTLRQKSPAKFISVFSTSA